MKKNRMPWPIAVDEDPPFWLVWSPDGPTEPRLRYETFASARWAARAMAAKHPGQTFFTLKAKSTARTDADVPALVETFFGQDKRAAAEA